ncbi:MAG: hypothetical protein HC897_20225 [Thermoanaerobaculia bacterium]|nr:hypothetical protein [Thermoanaerobaculia bacterium]
MFAFPGWLAVLEALNLSPVIVSVPSDIDWRLHSSGESEAHRALKERVAVNPEIVGFTERPFSAVVEYCFRTGDTVDVFFQGRTEQLYVEVKSHEAPEGEIFRGLLQCVKYQALATAIASIEGSQRETRTVLALGGPLPANLRPLINTLGITVVDGLAPRG